MQDSKATQNFRMIYAGICAYDIYTFFKGHRKTLFVKINPENDVEAKSCLIYKANIIKTITSNVRLVCMIFDMDQKILIAASGVSFVI